MQLLRGRHFSSPLNPASSTVWTSWPAKSRLRWRVTHSSSSNFTFEQPFLGEFQNPTNLFAGDGGKLVEKLIDRFALFDAVEQVLNWNRCRERLAFRSSCSDSLRLSFAESFVVPRNPVKMDDLSLTFNVGHIYHFSWRIRSCRNCRSGSCCVKASAFSYEARASAVLPSLRYISARAECAR